MLRRRSVSHVYTLLNKRKDFANNRETYVFAVRAGRGGGVGALIM